MTLFNVIVNHLQEDDMIGVEVTIQDIDGVEIDRITIVNAEQLEELKKTITDATENAYGDSDVKFYLENNKFTTQIDSVSVGGTTLKQLEDYIEKEIGDASVKKHASKSLDFGASTNTLLGHGTTRNDIVANGIYQNYENAGANYVKNLLGNLNPVIAWHNKESEMIFYRGTETDEAYTRIQLKYTDHVNNPTRNRIVTKIVPTSKNMPLAGHDINYIINGQLYDHKTDSEGKTYQNIRLEVGNYNVTVNLGNNNGLNRKNRPLLVQVLDE
jgi:hypothetical protein